MNESQRILLLFFLLVASLVAGVLVVRAVRMRRKVFWADVFAVMTGGVIVWVVGNALTYLAPNQSFWSLAAKIRFLGTGATTLGFLLFSIQHTLRLRKIPAWVLWVAVPLNLFVQVVIWTNELHGWMWTGWPGAGDVTMRAYGPFQTVELLLVYSQVLIGLVLLARSFVINEGILRFQAGLLAVGVLAPVMIGLAEDLGGMDWIPGIEEAALSLVFTVLIFALVTFFFRAFELIPIAHKNIIEQLLDGVIVLDWEGQLVTYNPSAEKILGRELKPQLGKSFIDILGDWSPDARDQWASGRAEFVVQVSTPGENIYRVAARELAEEPPHRSGWLVMLYDITAQKRMENRLQEMAVNDPLTGCFNRGHFIECAGKQFRQALRYRRPLSVAMIDLDHFKQVNDEYGHSVGDKILRRVVTSSLAALRRSDIFARYGGDEFVLMMPETEAAEAILVAERLRMGICGQYIQGGPVTVSVGVAHLNPEMEVDLDGLLAQADAAMYASKQSGRNRVTLWDPSVMA